MIEYIKENMEYIVDALEEKCEIMIMLAMLILEITLTILLGLTLPIWIIPFYAWKHKKE